MEDRTIENPVTGERVTFVETSRETSGARTVAELDVTPGGGVPTHRHTDHEERIEVVEGEIEVTNTNGSVVLENVAGSVIAHATNGRVLVSLRDVTPDKPMSFTSMNASLDITLPANVKANLRMRTDNGEIYSGFDITRRPGTPTTEDSRSRGGLFRVLTDQTINGTINGGGPNFDLRTLNGNIYIRKGK